MKTKSILLLVVAILLFMMGFILLIAEPVPGCYWDTFSGIIVEKLFSAIVIALGGCALGSIETDDWERIKSWVKLHF